MDTTTEHARWKEQWAAFAADIDDEERILRRWIAPMALEEVRGLDVLDAGCGSGIHTAILLRAGARRVTGIDYAAWEVARDRFGHLEGASFAFHDLCASPPPGEHDLVVNIGVLPHVSDASLGTASAHNGCRSKAAAGSVFDIDWCKAGAAAVQGAVRGVAAGAGARR
jgi:2-polyprenyl-3-methyl-5-hydroxy-6-metoxy-1,4-benzoquinol methylase